MTDTIAELTARLKAEHESACEAFRRGVLYAMNCGDLLNEIKAKLGYGNWEHWLKTESPVAPRTARRWQRLANHRAEIEANLPNLADLTVSAAEQLILSRDKYESCRKQAKSHPSITVKNDTRTIASQILDMQDDVLLAEAERDLEVFQFRYEAWPQLVQGARELRAMVARIRKKEVKAKAATPRIVH